jgi:hypothetical protein
MLGKNNFQHTRGSASQISATRYEISRKKRILKILKKNSNFFFKKTFSKKQLGGKMPCWGKIFFNILADLLRRFPLLDIKVHEFFFFKNIKKNF